jgi:ssDNA-binding Zn-finger/Zn-ribbon topoisomerase 1
MATQDTDRDARQLKVSAHVCPQCGFSVDLKDLGFRGSATGLVTCPKCEWSGPVTIGIVPKEPAS